MNREEWNKRCTSVCHGLLIGEVGVRSRCEWLIAAGVDTVVSCLTNEQHQHYDERYPCLSPLRHTRFSIDDNDLLEPSQIDAVLDAFGTKTLLHCISGVNRSQAIAICWMMSRGMGAIGAQATWNRTRAKDIARVYGAATLLSPNMEANVRRWAETKGILP